MTTPTNHDYDAIVVGARCAGSPTAMLLARRGHRVLVVDRATFPSDTLSTLVIHGPGVAALDRWGLLDGVLASGCPRLDTYVFDFGPVVISGSPLPHPSFAIAPRRTVLDKLLVDAAAAAGADLREGVTVEDVVVERGTVVGIRAHDGTGARVDASASPTVRAMTIDLDPKSAGFDPARLARIDGHLQRNYVDRGRIAGCQVLVARHGHVAHRSSLGLMDLARAAPVADTTIWRLYSMTKPITGVALLGLYEQAKCKLTDPIARYLPEWRDVGVRVERADGAKDVVAAERPITIRDAMMHMTGIGFGPPEARLDLADLAEGGPARRLPPGTTLADLSVLLAREPLRFQPGAHWLYSWSTDICARLVEVIAGESFGDHLQRTIFDPLGMVDTGFRVRDDNDAPARVAALYARTADKTLRLVDDPARGALVREPSLQSGGGGLVGTLDDYARFCQMLLAGGELDGHRVLARPTVELMRTNHLPGDGELRDVALPGGYGEVGFDGSGFGLTVAVGLGPRRSAGVGPAGSFMWGGAASTIFWIDPVEDLFVVFMTQLLPSGTFDFRGQLRALTYGAIND